MRRGMEMLQERMNGLDTPPREEIFSSHFIWRESCARASATV